MVFFSRVRGCEGAGVREYSQRFFSAKDTFLVPPHPRTPAPSKKQFTSYRRDRGGPTTGVYYSVHHGMHPQQNVELQGCNIGEYIMHDSFYLGKTILFFANYLHEKVKKAIHFNLFAKKCVNLHPRKERDSYGTDRRILL